MLLRKQLKTGSINNVHYANGKLQFQSVKLNVHCYTIDGIAIDTGAYSLRKPFQSFFNTQSLDAIYCTHIHEDHTGGAALCQRAHNLPIYLHASSVDEARKKGKYPLYRRLFWGKRPAFIAYPAPDTFQSRTCTWHSIFTPGHTSDHLSYLNSSTGQLFSGDLFVQTRTNLILRTESIPQIIQSIQRVLTYDFNEMFCCHAGYVKNGREKLKTKLAYLSELTGQVHHLHAKGLTVKEIHQQLFPHTYPISRLSSGEWHSRHIITSILEEKKINHK